MSTQGAHRAVVVSALVVFGTYFYRLLTEGHSSSGGSLLGIGSPPNVGKFITGWGFAFFVLSIVAEASPPLGGSLAILVAAGDVLANGSQVASDVNRKIGGAAQAQRIAPKGIAVPQTTGQLEQIPTLIPGTIPTQGTR